MTTDLSAPAGRIRQLRAVMRLSKQALADLAGVSLRAIDYWESGETNPRWISVIRVANATGCDFAWLMTGNGPEPVCIGPMSFFFKADEIVTPRGVEFHNPELVAIAQPATPTHSTTEAIDND